MEYSIAGLEDGSTPSMEFIEGASPLSLGTSSPKAKATAILEEVLQFRRMASAHVCGPDCGTCKAPHLPKVLRAIVQDRPITFVLPAFPGKSPNLAKVLGPLPDMAEERSLEFLENLCKKIGESHSPGAKIILCSDGRVFSDAVGIREEDISAYQDELSAIIERRSFTSISTFNLDDVYPGIGFEDMRSDLMEKYGRSLEELRGMVREGSREEGLPADKDAHRLYCGITRFLFEDSMHPEQKQSRAAVQKDARRRAYEVIRRSNAWSGLIENLFPDSVRLSIHPQACGSKKLGIRLLEGDSWMTPWHGVAVEVRGQTHLLKKTQAEALGARLVELAGRPSHYVLSEIV